MSLPVLLGAGLALNAAAALAAFRRGSLDPGGALVGALVGTIIFGLGGPLFWLVLVAFFVTSTAVGLVRREEKAWLRSLHEKGERRDLFQVLANGGLGALSVALYRITGEPAWAAAFAASFAASNADTWASEIGVLSRGVPVSILTFRPVGRGMSGGVSLLGTAAALLGALFIGIVFGLENLALRALAGGSLRIALFVGAAGFAGSLLDSLLGATIQAQYAARGAPGELTERHRNAEGTPNRLARGLPFVTNDAVNFLSGAAVTCAVAFLAPRFF